MAFSQAEHIKYTYDAAGNRTVREYVPPPPEVNGENDGQDDGMDNLNAEDSSVSRVAEAKKEEVQNEVDGSTVVIYPNPTRSSVDIELGDLYNKELAQSFDLIDLNGKLVEVLDVSAPSTTISLEGYNSGMYYIQFKENGLLTESWKIVKVD